MKKKKPARKKPKVGVVKKKAPPTVDPARAEAAVEVLEHVFLHEKHFDLESEIVREGVNPIATTNANEEVWITVRLHVPRLDIDTWIDGTHCDHPNNQPDDDENNT